MGYYAINSATIWRDYDTREIIAEVFHDDQISIERQHFKWDELDEAVAWIAEKMTQLSM